MKPTELLLPNRRGAGVFMCSQCRHIHPTREAASQCCICAHCGEGLDDNRPTGASMHPACAKVSRERKHAAAPPAAKETVVGYDFPLHAGSRPARELTLHGDVHEAAGAIAASPFSTSSLASHMVEAFERR